MKPLDLSDDAVWKQRFHAWQVRFFTLAQANPDRVCYLSNESGVYQAHAWNRATDERHQLTYKKTGVRVPTLSADGQWVYYLHDDDDNEIGHYVRIPFEGGEPEDITPDLPYYSSFFFDENKTGTHIGFMAATKDGFQCYVLDKQSGEANLVTTYTAISAGPLLNDDASLGAVATTAYTVGVAYSTEVFDIATGESLGVLTDGESISIEPWGFGPDDQLLATTDRSGFARPLIWNPRTGERRDMDLPELDGQIMVMDWVGDTLLLCQLNRASYQLYTYNLASDTLHTVDHLAGTYSSAHILEDGSILALRQTATRAPHIVEIDPTTGEDTITVESADAPEGLAWRSVDFPSSDGTLIQAWVATPEGEAPYPTLIHIHGGPTSVQLEVYSPAIQAWLDHGFAVLSINYRGSTTFGSEFQHQITGDLGNLEVEDIIAAREWLVENHIAQPDSIFLTGGSYGGYLTLQTSGKRPGLWAGGMASVAIADWNLMYEDMAETLRGYHRALFGGTPDDNPEQHRKSSPITYAEQIDTPLMVIQGRNDTRCPSRQMEAYEQRLKELNKPIEITWFEAGHGSLSTEDQIHHMELMLHFAYRQLG